MKIIDDGRRILFYSNLIKFGCNSNFWWSGSQESQVIQFNFDVIENSVSIATTMIGNDIVIFTSHLGRQQVELMCRLENNTVHYILHSAVLPSEFNPLKLVLICTTIVPPFKVY